MKFQNSIVGTLIVGVTTIIISTILGFMPLVPPIGPFIAGAYIVVTLLGTITATALLMMLGISIADERKKNPSAITPEITQKQTALVIAAIGFVIHNLLGLLFASGFYIAAILLWSKKSKKNEN